MAPRGKKRAAPAPKGDTDTGNEPVVETSTAAPATKKPKSEGKASFRVKIEHWFVERNRNADQLAEALRAEFPAVVVETAVGRSKSFECKVIKDDGTEMLVWTGIKKGPPRKLKFPEPSVVVDAINNETSTAAPAMKKEKASFRVKIEHWSSKAFGTERESRKNGNGDYIPSPKGRNADQLAEALRAEFPAVVVETAVGRSKSFECTVIKDDGKEMLVWTGIKKGPPRKLKFPEPSVVVKAINNDL
ncbi:SELENOH [Branchiostoma lanceolatum]|uniref:SELENOH protein n=1 Tax=Branchiostoma lanceolatum TaxID=7740 RepID=A0A8J9VM91_BRALA|nr:SELENOH [Branchiostoma lanceolatum]